MVADQARYPGATVACTSVLHGTDLVPEPAVVFEVLSAGTAATDRIQANDEYWLTPQSGAVSC